MKKDKRLQEYANKTMEQYNDPKILEQLKQYIKPKKAWHEKIPRKSWYAIGGSFATVAIVAVVLLCVFLIEPVALPTNDTNPTPNVSDNPSDTPVIPPKKEYFGNVLSANSSIQKVNQYTANLDLTENNIAYVKKHTDSQYGDILYFSLRYVYEETIEEIVLNVVTNEDYEYDFKDATNWTQTTYKDFELLYEEKVTEEDGLYFFTVNAILKTDKEDIAIKYEGVGLEETSNFLLALDQVFVQ